MRRLPVVLSALCLGALFAGATIAAHADTVNTYDISGTLAQGGSFTGTFTVDVGPYSSPITSLDVTVTGSGAGVFDSGTPGTTFGSSPSYAQVEFSYLFLFYLRVDPSNGYALCTALAPCSGDYTKEVDSSLPQYQNPVETATVALVTPEPSSLFLFGTGLMSAAGFARRRFLKV